jgi:NB-ARC domain/Trypsin-like peptidase domain
MTPESLEVLLEACTVRVEGGQRPGAGFFVAPGRVLTCVHVIGGAEGEEQLNILWNDMSIAVLKVLKRLNGGGRPMPKLDDYPDVALLEVDIDKHPCVRVDETWPEDGDRFWAYGFPKEGDADNLSTSVRLKYNGMKGHARYIDLASGTVRLGMSGGALLNVRSGGVCGIVVATRSEHRPEGGFAVPWKAVREDLKEVINANRNFHHQDQDKRWERAAKAREHPTSKPLDDVVNQLPCPPQADLVGQDKLIARVEEALRSGQSVGLYGLGGAGKTSVVNWVARHLESEARFERVLSIKLGKTPKDTALQILEKCANSLGAVEGHPARLSPTPSAEELGEWRCFLSAAAEKRGGVLVVIDDCWPGKVAEATVEALRLGAPSVMVITGRDKKWVAARVPGGYLAEVFPLDKNAAFDLLLSQIGEPRVPETFHPDFRALVRKIGGLPIAIVILAGVPRAEWLPPRENTRDLQKVLVKLADRTARLKETENMTTSGKSLRLVLKTSVSALSKDARRVLAGLSVLRPEPAAFAESMMIDLAVTLAWDQTEDPEDLKALKKRADQALEALRRASLLSETRNVTSAKERALMLHPVVADYAVEYLVRDAREVVRLHQKAASYFGKIASDLSEPSESAESSLSAAYHCENPGWQDAAINWIYHLGHESGDAAHHALATLYLDAFWWWGCFESYPFCKDLLDWLEQVEVPGQGRKGHDETGTVLRQFQTAYPTGLEKAGRGDWKTVRRSLLRLRELLGIAEEGEHSAWRTDAECRHLRAISNIFLAHAARYGAPESAEPRAQALKTAADYYEQAWELIDQDDDAWNLPYILIEWAETNHERGLGGIEQMCNQAESLAAEEGDCEILGLSARLRGLLALDRGEVDQAFRWFGLAVVHYYVFQVSQPSGFPDPYTKDFYEQLKSWVLDRVKALANDARPAACEALLAVWGNCWCPPHPPDVARLSDGRAELAAALWPPGPTDDELEASRDRYATEVRARVECLYANPPDGLLQITIRSPATRIG